jgi:pre-mRNA-splicing factor CWC22
MFIAHLVNQQVVNELVALELLFLLLERPTDDSVEIAVAFMKECGAYLTDASPTATMAVFERFRSILHEASIDKRIQYMIEVLFQVRKDKFKDNPAIITELDLVEPEDRVTHNITLDEDLEVQDILNVFKFDPSYIENEDKYKDIKREILGESDSEADDSDEETDSSDSDDEQGENQSISVCSMWLSIQLTGVF